MTITVHTDLPHTRAKLREVIGQAIGTASMCWENPAGAGVFDSVRASALVEDVLAKVEDLTSMNDPSLGLATTARLVEELATRVRLHDPIGSFAPNYRTVDPDCEHVTDETGECWCGPLQITTAPAPITDETNPQEERDE